MRDRRRAGGAGATMLMLLALVVAAGAWNYHKNLSAEDTVLRPLQGYSDVELDALDGAIETYTKTQAEEYEEAASQRAHAETKSYFDEQVAEFERVQQVGATKMQAQLELAGSRVAQKLLEDERRFRLKERKRIKIFLKRLLTI